MHKRAALRGAARALGLVKRVPELMNQRGWPHANQDLVAVLIAAVACKKLGAGAQLFRRPDAAGACGGTWLEGNKTASQIVEALDLHELLTPR